MHAALARFSENLNPAHHYQLFQKSSKLSDSEEIEVLDTEAKMCPVPVSRLCVTAFKCYKESDTKKRATASDT